ncbi:MAG TPA: glycine-rich protein [Solirubrobacterales bacterium]|nr:glycine-rich protein [Solirubrobacterales bacterium]
MAIAFVMPTSAGATTVTFEHTGAAQVWTVPYGVTSATWDLFGAEGMGFDVVASRNQGGNGGRALATINVTGGSTIHVMVGGKGGLHNPGFNGGGVAVWAGGGATDIRVGGTALSDRVLVAGGGGAGNAECLSATGSAFGGSGSGGPTGGSGTFTGCNTTPGGGGTQSAGGSPNGSLGQGGSGAFSGGGGGYYGGGGSDNGTGGGGSGFGPPGYTWNAGIRNGDGVATVTYEITDTRNLFASSAGPGDGYVSSSPEGIDCGVDGAPGHDDCTEAYGRNQPVTVTAHPSPGSVFDQWIFGPCMGSTTPTCQVTLDQADPEQPKIVSARFKVAPVTETHQYTGQVVRWEMPYGVSAATIDLYGAQGGGSDSRSIPGLGGRATATIYPPGGTPYWLRVGGAGTPQAGGFNGGGSVSSGWPATMRSAGGGGATDLRSGNDTLAARVLVAGGGGGGGQQCSNPDVVSTGGAGGGLSGEAGELNFSEGNYPPGCNITKGTGGTQTKKGSWSYAYPDDDDGGPQNVGGGNSFGGGGGGYYGGGSGQGGPGGGGSSFGPAGYTTQSGVREGNGLAIITYDITSTRGLTVTANGPGDGYLSSSPDGIDCGTPGAGSHEACYSVFGTGQPVTLTANPDSGSTFSGWGGACSGTQLTCDTTLSEARSVTASFAQGPRKLTVTRTGNGAGTVSSTPSGIACGSSCNADYPFGTEVELTPAEATGSDFTGWTGACSGTGACSVTMDQVRNVGATFTLEKLTLRLAKFENGSGSVVSSPAGIDFPAGATPCDDGRCVTAQFDYGTEVTLTPTAATGSTFADWGGDCEGVPSDQACVVTMDADRSAEADFVLQKRALDVERTGSGTGGVTSAPAGIECGSTCMDEFDYGTEVTLAADPDEHSQFTGWSGACSGVSDCVVTMDEAREVSAGFALEKRTLDVDRSGNGTGTVTSQPAGVECGDECEGIEFDHGTEVTLTANPAPTSEFAGWTGDCSGSGTTCTVTLDEARSVGAAFSLQKRSLTVTESGTGSGDVTANPTGAEFDFGTTVTLEAVPANGSTFTGWSGDCSGTGTTCALEMTDARTVDATFTVDPSPVDPAPVIRQLKVKPRKVPLGGRKKTAIRRKGPAIKISVSEASTVRFTVKRKPGRALGFARVLKAGANTVKIPARIRRKLKLGRVLLAATATDEAGQKSKPRQTRFRVVRR